MAPPPGYGPVCKEQTYLNGKKLNIVKIDTPSVFKVAFNLQEVAFLVALQKDLRL